jgi:PAS domain S-box-containing protein
VSKARILIVEDNAVAARNIAQQLARSGYEAAAQTARGEDALVMADQLRPDLVLMDIQLAGEMDGISAAQAIWQQFAIPVVFLTASEGDETLERAKVAEPFGYIIKPFQDRELRAVIEMALYKYRAEVALRESEQQCRDLAELLPQTVYEIDHEGRLTFFNRQAFQTFGYTQADFEAGLSCFQMLASYERERARHNVQLAIGGQDLGGIEYTAQRKDGTQFPVVAYSSLILRHNMPVGLRGIVVDVTESKRAQMALAASEARYRRLFEAAKDGILILDAETGAVHDVNPFLVELLGYPRKQFLGKRIWELGFFKDIAANQANFAELQRQEYIRYEDLPLETADGRRINVEFVSNVYLVDHQKVIQCNIRDITERRITQSERAITIDVLRLISQRNSHHELLRGAMALLHKWSGCEAVGIRLREGEDFPYFETRGFPPEFVLAENRLCEVDTHGEVKRDGAGDPVLECMCGNVIRGRFNPAKPFFTPRGSFWTNCTTELLAGTTEADRQGHTRNRCNSEGYESVALIPLRASGETFGLLQLNDRRKGRFTAREISLLERLADSVALGLAHRKSQEALHLRERAINTAGEGICITGPNEAGNPLIYVNQGFSQLTGYPAEEVLAKNMRFLQGADTDQAAVERMRAAIESEQEFTTEVLNYRKDNTPFWNQISITPVKNATGKVAHFVAVLHDATERKQAEDADKRLALIVESSDDAIIAKTLDGTILTWNAGAERLYGYSAAEVVGNSLSILLPPESVDELPRILARIRRGERIAHYETTRIGKGRRRIQVSLTVSPLTDAHGNIVGASTIAHDITERNQTEAALRESEERFRSLIEGAPEAIFVQSAGRFVYVNPAACKLFGALRPVDLLGTAFMERMAPEHIDAINERIRLQRETGNPVPLMDQEHLRLDGSRVPVETAAVSIRYQGKDAHLVFVRDITERKRAEGALRESEEKFRNLFNNAEVGMFRSRLDGSEMLDLNDKYLSTLGRSREEIVGKPSVNCWADPREREEMVKTLKAKGYANDLQCRMIKKDGKVINCSASLRLFAEQGILEGSIIDITDRKRAEEEYRTLFREMLDGFALHEIICDEQGNPADYRFLAVNPAFERITGLKAEGVVGRTVLETLPGVESHWIETYGRVALTGEPAFFENYAANLNKYFEVSAFRPAPNQFACIFVDITGRKQAEAARKEDENRLTALEMQLTHASRLATLGELAAGIAHEVNQPLCAIVNFAKACKNTASHEAPDLHQICEWCDSIAMAAARSGDIIRGMLGFARKYGSARATVAIGQVVTDAIQLVRYEAHARKAALLQEIPDQGLAVYVAPVQIHQVLVNLLRNAIDALENTHPDDGRVVVRAGRVDGMVQVSVSDNGPGQPEAELPKIFEPFFTTKPQGLGMGLAISRTIIEDHGGRIWATGNEGGGLTIHFTLPVEKDTSQDVPEQNRVRD